MRFEYPYDDPERSLAPFFAPAILWAAFKGVLAVGALSMVFWPWHPVGYYMGRQSIPIHFFLVMSATLVAVSWVNLWCGCGEMVARDAFGRVDKERTYFETQRSFLHYGLVGFIVHTAFLTFIFLPFMLLSASVSGVSLPGLGLALSIVFGTALLCRMFGFSIYLLWGRRRFMPYWVTRLAAVLLLFASALLLPAVNPIRLFYELNRTVRGLTNSYQDSYLIYLLFILGANVIFGVLNHTLVNRRLRTAMPGSGGENTREPV